MNSILAILSLALTVSASGYDRTKPFAISMDQKYNLYTFDQGVGEKHIWSYYILRAGKFVEVARHEFPAAYPEGACRSALKRLKADLKKFKFDRVTVLDANCKNARNRLLGIK